MRRLVDTLKYSPLCERSRRWTLVGLQHLVSWPTVDVKNEADPSCIAAAAEISSI